LGAKLTEGRGKLHEVQTPSGEDIFYELRRGKLKPIYDQPIHDQRKDSTVSRQFNL
jgi:hypothetical protein